MSMQPSSRTGPLFIPRTFDDIKDPCPVFDGKQWHIFGSGGTSKSEVWSLCHAVAPAIEGPWTELDPIELVGVEGPHVAAPGVVFDPADGRFHMFLQTDFMALDTTVEYLVSTDGHTFERINTALTSLPMTTESGIYDPHPSDLGDDGKYIMYSGCTQVSRPDLYVVRSVSGNWEGPWQRMGRILRHEEVHHHNQHGHEDYEWGLEGAQLVKLPSGIFLLIAVCFLPEGKRGTRQRVFYSVSDRPDGRYYTLGPVLEPAYEQDWESGENGHAAAVIEGDDLVLFYQARSADETSHPWRYGIARYPLAALEARAQEVLESERSRKI
jgi:hypothetical protein